MKHAGKPVFVYPSVVAIALYYAVLGYLIPAIRTRFDLSLLEAGLFSTMQSVGFFISLLLCFCVFGALNKPRVMAASLLLSALCLAGLAVAPSVALLCALFLFTGIFTNILDTLSNAVIADLAGETRGRHIGLLQALFSAAGAAASYFALLLGGEYTVVFVVLAMLSAVSLLPFTLGLRGEMRRPWLQSPQGFLSLRKVARLVRVRGVMPVVTAAFVGIFVQISLTFFLSSYVGDADGAGAFALCMLYSGALAGRLVFSRLSRRVDSCRIMAVGNALALAGIVTLLLVRDATLIGLVALLPGFGLSANFPGLIVRACGMLPEDSAAASALIFLGVNTAACTAPPLVGFVGDTLGLHTAFALCAALLVPMILLSVWLGSRHPTGCIRPAAEVREQA